MSENLAQIRAVLAPELAQLEKERAAITLHNKNVLAIIVGIVAACAGITYVMHDLAPLKTALISGTLSYFIFSHKDEDKWHSAYKKRVIGAIVNHFFGAAGEYQPKIGHSKDVFNATKLFDTDPNRYNSEDMIKSVLDKTSFYFSEIDAQHTTGSGKNRRTVTIFQGILFTADFNKHFQGQTIVKQKGFWNFMDYGNTVLENPIFMDTFSVYTNDSVEARYILTPSLMEKMLLLNQNWGGSMAFSFMYSTVTIAIPLYHNFFETSIWKSLEKQNNWEKDWQLIADLIDIVQVLDLNTRIWTKE